ncbi:hypothetical protein Tco_0544252 [Tanacetum coccineum]
MSSDSAVTYTSVHFEARTWSIPSEDPYDEAARQVLEQAPRSPEYVLDPIELEDHILVYILEPECPEHLEPSEDEAPIEALFICGGKKEDVGLDELGEGCKGVVSKIGEFGGDRVGEKEDRGFVVIGEVGDGGRL